MELRAPNVPNPQTILSQDFLMLNAKCNILQRDAKAVFPNCNLENNTSPFVSQLKPNPSHPSVLKQIKHTKTCNKEASTVLFRNVPLLLHIYLQLCCFGSTTYSHVMQWHGRDWASSCWFKSAPTLGLHDPTRSFTQTERSSCMTSVWLQDHVERQWTVAYFFTKPRWWWSRNASLCTSCCCSWKGRDGLTWYCCLLWSNLACSQYSFSYSSRAVIFVNSTLAQIHCSSALHAKHHCLKQLKFFNGAMPLSAAGEVEEHNCVGTACCTYNLDINSYGHGIDERIINKNG